MTYTDDPVFLVFSGYNQRAVFTFLRKLSAYSRAPIIVAVNSRDPILNTVYSSYVRHIRETPELSWPAFECILNSLRDVVGTRQICLAPTSEALNRFALLHRDALAAYNIQLPLVDLNLYAQVSDKYAFGELCKRHGIAVPEDITEPESAALPFVAKQRTYDQQEAKKPYLLSTESARVAFLTSQDRSQYYFQRYVSGASYYLLAYFRKDGSYHLFSQQNLLQQPHGGSIVAARASDYHHASSAHGYVKMLQSIGFSGLIMIEVRKEGHSYYMIEANPRFWGPSQLFVDAMEVDLFDSFIRDTCNLPELPPKPRRSDYYFWYDGFQQSVRSSAGLTFHTYTPQELMTDLPVLLENDIYNRPDTRPLFLQSISREE